MSARSRSRRERIAYYIVALRGDEEAYSTGERSDRWGATESRVDVVYICLPSRVKFLLANGTKKKKRKKKQRETCDYDLPGVLENLQMPRNGTKSPYYGDSRTYLARSNSAPIVCIYGRGCGPREMPERARFSGKGGAEKKFARKIVE